jgi:translation elongation factor EF-Tu-like GTPase
VTPGSVARMFRLTVEDVFVIRGRGLVATGRVESGVLRVGDEVQIDGGAIAIVEGVEMFRKAVHEAAAGDNIGLLFRSLDRSQLTRGAVLTSTEPGPPTEGLTVKM